MPQKPVLPPCLLLIVLLGLMPVATAVGQAGPLSLQGSFGLTATSFAERTAGTGGSFGLRLGFTPRLFDVLAAHLEGGLEYLGPICFEAGEACQTQQAPSSETFMVSGSAAVGVMPRLFYFCPRPQSKGVNVALGVFGGREWVKAGLGRGECLNCSVSDLGLRGGFFVEPALELWFFPGVALGAAYRFYSAAADLDGRFTIRFIARD